MQSGTVYTKSCVLPNTKKAAGHICRQLLGEVKQRGFGEQDALLDEVKSEAIEIIEDLLADEITEIKLLQEHLHDGIGQLVYDRTRRRPMILPVVLEV